MQASYLPNHLSNLDSALEGRVRPLDIRQTKEKKIFESIFFSPPSSAPSGIYTKFSSFAHLMALSFICILLALLEVYLSNGQLLPFFEDECGHPKGCTASAQVFFWISLYVRLQPNIMAGTLKSYT